MARTVSAMLGGGGEVGGRGSEEGGGVEEARNVYGLGKGIRKCS